MLNFDNPGSLLKNLESLTTRVKELEGLVERAKLLIDPCYPKKHADWQNDAHAVLNTGDKT